MLGQLRDFGFAVCGVDDDAPAGLIEGKAAYFSAGGFGSGTLQPSSQMARLVKVMEGQDVKRGLKRRQRSRNEPGRTVNLMSPKTNSLHVTPGNRLRYSTQ